MKKRNKIKKIILSLLLTTSFYSHADELVYGALAVETGVFDVGSSEFDVSALQLGLSGAIASSNIVFSISAASGTVDDVAGYDLDFVARGISLGYALGDITTGSFVLGATYSSGEIQNPGSSNIETSNTEPYIGYSKMSGEGVDYKVSISDGIFNATAIIPSGFTENFKTLIGYGTSEDIDTLTFGVAYKF